MKMYLDDLRIPHDNYDVIVRSFEDAINFVNKNGIPSYISFDHDLGCDENGNILKSGFDFADSIAKGILIKFIIHEEQSLFLINSCRGEISDLSSDDCEIIFGTELDNSIDINMLNYEIIVTEL